MFHLKNSLECVTFHNYNNNNNLFLLSFYQVDVFVLKANLELTIVKFYAINMYNILAT